jgi:hypothetical protein
MSHKAAATVSAQGGPPPIAPTTGRLICLGERQSWARRAIDTDTLRFGVPSEPHDLCFAGDWDGAKKSLVRAGKAGQKASELTGQLRTFYTAGLETLWITRVKEHLWWGFAEPEVIDLRGSGDNMGVVARRVRGGWSCHSLRGRELLLAELRPRFKVLRSSNPFCRLDELDDIFAVIDDR